MIRNLKTLGLAFVAVFALSAVAASAAQAVEGSLTYEAGTTELTATQDEAGGVKSIQKFTTTSGKVECNEVHGIVTEGQFSAHEATGEEIEYTNNGSSECPSVLGTKATIDTMGCHYTFHTGETTAEMTVDGTVTIEGCEEDPETGFKGITVNAAGCTITVPEQTISPVMYTDTTEGDVTIESTVGEGEGSLPIEYTHKGFLCGTGTAKDGTYNGNVTVTGKDANGNPTNIGVE